MLSGERYTKSYLVYYSSLSMLKVVVKKDCVTIRIYYGGPMIVNRTYGTHKNLYIYLFLLTIFGPIYYGPPS